MKLRQKYNTFMNEVRKVFTISNSHHKNKETAFELQESANFETAIAATGFGKYNLLLCLITIPAGMAFTVASTTMAFVVPVAECDLNLTLENKGMLNAVTYIGMITSGFFWGFLSDTIGRRKLLVIGFLSNGLVVLLGGFSQHYIMLVVLKFLEGIIINGPFATLVSYLNEFHCAKYRSFIPAVIGVINSTSSIALPFLGWLILTKPVEINIFTSFIVLRSWNLFLLICSIPSLTAGCLFMLFPESPKFQMTIGKNDLAYKTFQNIYSWNNKNSSDKYPIKALAYETGFSEANDSTPKSKIQAMKHGWKQLLPLFHPPYGGKMILVATIQMLIMMGLQTLRLWLPQLFAAVSNYQVLHQNTMEEEADLCKMLEILQPDQTPLNRTCTINYNIDSAYTNNIIVAMAGIGCFLIGAVITCLLGKKLTLASFSIIGGTSGICMYFAKNVTTATVLSSLFIGLAGVSSTTLLSIVVDIFPTTLRTMTVALSMVSGRIGAMTGNLIFPSLLVVGCLPPFVTLGSFVIGGAILALALPKTDTKELE